MNGREFRPFILRQAQDEWKRVFRRDQPFEARGARLGRAGAGSRGAGAGAATGAGAGAGAGTATAGGAGGGATGAAVWTTVGAGCGMFQIAVQGWPTCTGPEPTAAIPAVHGCPAWTVQPSAVLPGLAADGAGAAGAAVLAAIASDGGRSVAQPAVSTSSAAEAAEDQFFFI